MLRICELLMPILMFCSDSESKATLYTKQLQIYACLLIKVVKKIIEEHMLLKNQTSKN